ncbi:MAG TPA: LysE family translocator [Jatrophihabitans sp.]|nr:LysE family translocator [Jatrophihabitans sp.]
MELLRQLPAFLAAVVLISAVPGPAVALLIRRCSAGGFRAGVPVVLGLEAGLYLWILAAGAGLAALVATSHVAYLVLRVVGAAVLLVLGVQALRAARRGAYDAELSAARVLPRGRGGGFAMGLLTNAANPKAAVFTFAFYPQFIPSGYPLLPTAAALGLLQIGVEICLYLSFAALVGRVRNWFAQARVRRRLDALCGAVLVALGLRVATESQ